MAGMTVSPVSAATGEQMYDPAVAVTSINNADGGTTSAGLPAQLAWESFANMCVIVQHQNRIIPTILQAQQRQAHDVRLLQSNWCSSRHSL